MWQKLLGGLIGGPLEKYIDYRKRKKELEHERELEKVRGKIAYEKAKTERAIASEGYDADWETLSIQNSGWKDEATWVVLSIPMVAVFIPQLQPYVQNGFDTLQTLPEWYRWLVVMIYAATFGIRVWRRRA